ncbi:hypothetical protein PPMP20_22560 [Paraburkholderia phymatum]|uniref:VOC domain-containing protein n=1 Tax=Paraburkholderia phymatum (strain DSM 17167 / CIP 108236 / LMG 21445 / STM815) TaxID=391038 RepID=B2JNW5_PARP8|nr:hypothetical protein [Paraburkholderia phymatum]ACC74518.1 conserved hypothetical protein [Paraburkholderia phymatum STM815]
MIFHASIPTHNPERVARTLAEVWGGFAAPFSPFEGAWMAVAGDDRGTIIETYPSNMTLTPGDMREPLASITGSRPQYSGFHMAVASPLSAEQVMAIGQREGWRAVRCTRGNHFFDVIELWIENSTLIEVLTPEMQAQYLAFATPENFRQLAAQASASVVAAQ